MFDDWLGGFYASPGMQGTRSALPMATAWATLHHLGMEGYLRLTQLTLDTRARMVEGIRAIDGLARARRARGAARRHGARRPATRTPSTCSRSATRCSPRGWYHDRQKPPDSLHSTVSAGNAPVIEQYLADLAECVAEVGGTRLTDRSTSYATLE